MHSSNPPNLSVQGGLHLLKQQGFIDFLEVPRGHIFRTHAKHHPRCIHHLIHLSKGSMVNDPPLKSCLWAKIGETPRFGQLQHYQNQPSLSAKLQTIQQKHRSPLLKTSELQPWFLDDHRSPSNFQPDIHWPHIARRSDVLCAAFAWRPNCSNWSKGQLFSSVMLDSEIVLIYIYIYIWSYGGFHEWRTPIILVV